MCDKYEDNLTALIIGSGPDAKRAATLPLDKFNYIITINNAWQVSDAWTHLVYPYDFAPERMPPIVSTEQTLIDETAFVPAQNRFGGFVYAGGTMAYTTAYWCLDALRPKHILHLGCDMHYPKTGATHFYGTGTPDPLRDDISLTSLEACSARFYCLAYLQGSSVWNLSQGPSRLLYPRTQLDDFFATGQQHQPTPDIKKPTPDIKKIEACLEMEAALDYVIEDGRYWKHADKFDRKKLMALDQKWLEAASLLPAK